MKKLIILSDLWGKGKSEWVSHYVEALQDYFEVTFYDSCELAGIDLSTYTEDKIHPQFVNGGIEKAVNTLLARERREVVVLGFSIGGLIAWKAALRGLKTERLLAISSTRLRYEDKRPDCAVYLLFAENDIHQPGMDWFIKLQVERNICKDQEHDFYRNKERAMEIVNRWMKQ